MIRKFHKAAAGGLVVHGYTWSTNSRFFMLTLASAGLFVLVDGFWPRLFVAIVLSISCGFVGVPLLQAILGLPKLVKQYLTVSRALPASSSVLLQECHDLAIAMKAPLRGRPPVKVAAGWRNACARNASIVVGQPIAEEFDTHARSGVLAHEVAHIGAQRSSKQLLVCVPACLLLAQFVSSAGLPWVVNVLVVFSGMALTMSAASWACEFDADAKAARCVGTDAVSLALKALCGDGGKAYRLDTWSHPSCARRIARLRELES